MNESMTTKSIQKGTQKPFDFLTSGAYVHFHNFGFANKQIH